MKRSNEAWSQCGEGQISALTENLRSDMRRSAMKRQAALGAIAAIVVVVGMLTLPGTTSKAVAARPISCAQVCGLTEQILDDSLKGELHDRVQAHLEYCQRCADHVERTRVGTAQATQPTLTVASRD